VQKLNILQIVPHFNPRFGGEVNVCYNLSKQLAKKGHNVTILTSDFRFDKNYAKNAEIFGVQVIPFHTRISIGLFVYTPSINNWLRKNVKKFDLIHLHPFRSYQNKCCMNFALKNNIPYILQAHGSLIPFLEKPKLKKLYDFSWGNQLLKNASKLIAVSQVEKDQYLNMGLPEKKIEIIYNGIDVSEYETLPERGNFRKKHNIAPDEKIILYLGRLFKHKGLDFLVDGFSNLLDQYQDAILVIVGPDDGYLSILNEQIKMLDVEKNVLFTGPLYKNEKLEAFVDADVLIYPGQIEIFGLVPFEAIMCGTPVIVNDDCGCGEIIKEGQCGTVIKYGDIAELSKKIDKILANPADSKEQVKHGQIFISRNLAYEVTIEKFLELYSSCLKLKNLS
jgi:glycosyltransferase involved in cell wall biosynthesis